MTHGFLQSDALRLPFADQSFDLVFGSPPYMDARTYGIGAQRKCQEWVDFMLAVTEEAVRVSRGLVLWVIGGVTRKHCYWPGCEGLLWEWWKRGGEHHCWRPAFWHRVGIPGSGGKQWLRADVEYVMAFKKPGLLPWSDNTALGHAPKWAPGGEMSYRLSDGARVNQWGGNYSAGMTTGGVGADVKTKKIKPSHKAMTRRSPRGHANGDIRCEEAYVPPVLANPGNLIKGIKVGGGLMGDDACHKNEAPFPEKLAAWFLLGWCPPNGIVLDPFSGSGTTVCVAKRLGRNGIGCDVRMSQCELGAERLTRVQPEMFT